MARVPASRALRNNDRRRDERVPRFVWARRQEEEAKMITAERRKEIVESHRTHEKDTGSPQVQIALLTERIKAITDHLKGHRKDHTTRRGLRMLVGQRNRLLRYL